MFGIGATGFFVGTLVGALLLGAFVGAAVVGALLAGAAVEGDMVGSSAQTLRRQMNRKKRKEIFFSILFVFGS